MVWLTTDANFLIQGQMAPIPFIYGGVGLSDGVRFHESAPYYVMTQSGRVVKKYGEPMPFSIEDEMTVSNIHLVIGDALYDFYWSHIYPREARIEVTLRLRGLRLYETPLPFDSDGVIQAYEGHDKK
jgi:hypothetical protein